MNQETKITGTPLEAEQVVAAAEVGEETPAKAPNKRKRRLNEDT